MLLKALALPDQRSLQNHTSLFVPLAVLGGKLIDPAQFAVTVLTADVSDHVPAGEHDSVLHLAVLQVHHLVEQKSSACGSCESGGDQLRSISQDCVTVGTRKEPCSTNVVQEDTSHLQISLETLFRAALMTHNVLTGVGVTGVLGVF